MPPKPSSRHTFTLGLSEKGARFLSEREPYSFAVAHVEVADGPHLISADRPFGVIASGYDEEVSYAFTGGMRLEKLREAGAQPLTQVCLGGGVIGTPCESGREGICASEKLSQCAASTNHPKRSCPSMY